MWPRRNITGAHCDVFTFYNRGSIGTLFSRVLWHHAEPVGASSESCILQTPENASGKSLPCLCFLVVVASCVCVCAVHWAFCTWSVPDIILFVIDFPDVFSSHVFVIIHTPLCLVMRWNLFISCLRVLWVCLGLFLNLSFSHFLVVCVTFWCPSSVNRLLLNVVLDRDFDWF